MAMPAKKQVRYNYADYLTWDDDERRELIDGEIYVVSPAPRRSHQGLLGGLYFEIAAQFREKDSPCEVYLAPFDVRLPGEEDADGEETDVVQPDLVVVCDESKLDERGCRGAPDWVVEILSPSTASHDQITKRKLYERHGVREYWLVHPQDRVAWIYRSNPAGEYGGPEIVECSGSSDVGLLTGIEVDWERVFARVPREV